MVGLTLGVEKLEVHFRRDLLPALVYAVRVLQATQQLTRGHKDPPPCTVSLE